MSSLTVTPGYGASVATEIKGGAHHQHVISHKDIVKASVTPAITANTNYAQNAAIGGELIFQNVARISGDNSMLEYASVIIKGSTAGKDLSLLLYSDPLVTTPSNNQVLAVVTADISKVLGVIKFKVADFVSFGTHCIATVQVPLLLKCAADGTSVRGVLFSNSSTAVTFPAVDTLDVSLVTSRS